MCMYCMYMYEYIYIYIHVYAYMYILEMHQLEFFFLLESVAFLHWQHIEKVKCSSE